MLFVKASTTLCPERNSFAITRIKVYPGTAKIMPVTPASMPAMLITMKISKGCAFTLFEKRNGWVKKLSTN